MNSSEITISIADIPNDCLGLVLKEMILQGDYYRAIATCQEWRIRMRPIFLTLIPFFRSLIFYPEPTPAEDIEAMNEAFLAGEDVFGLPRLLTSRYGVEPSPYSIINIRGCAKVIKKGAEKRIRTRFTLKICVPFGTIKVLFWRRRCGAVMCGTTTVIVIKKICGDEATMKHYLHLLLPEIQDEHIYPSETCVVCHWKNNIIGHMQYATAMFGQDDAHDGRTPDMPDDEDYMRGYNNPQLDVSRIVAHFFARLRPAAAATIAANAARRQNNPQ